MTDIICQRLTSSSTFLNLKSLVQITYGKKQKIFFFFVNILHKILVYIT